MTAQAIQRDRLGALAEIGQGGQGVVDRAPNVKTKFAASMVYTEYKPQTLADIDFTALAAMPALVEDSLSYEKAAQLVSVAAWPCALVEDPGRSMGFVMPAIGEEFLIPLKTVKGVSNTTAEFPQLLNHASNADGPWRPHRNALQHNGLHVDRGVQRHGQWECHRQLRPSLPDRRAGDGHAGPGLVGESTVDRGVVR